MSQQNYKIFINEHTLHITDNKALLPSGRNIEYITPFKLISSISILEQADAAKPLYFALVCEDPESEFRRLKKQFKTIKASGGIVFNVQKQILLIKRLGRWDLPKGKAEKNEDTRLTALREVHEECGISFLGIIRKAGVTYHAYIAKGRRMLKKTTWFYMIAWDNTVTPQLEENITEVRWVDEAFIRDPAFDSYASIKDLLADVSF